MTQLPKPVKSQTSGNRGDLALGSTQRTWGGKTCYVDQNGDAFLIVRGSQAQGLQWRRYYGYLVNCIQCGREVFDRKGKRSVGPFCGTRCSKLGKRNPSTKAASQRGTVVEAVLDRLFGKIIRRSGTCTNCGKTRPSVVIECAHGFSRTYRGTRWDEANAWALCSGCHKFYTHRPIEWEDWMRTRLGDEGYQRLRMQAMAITKVDRLALYQQLLARQEELKLNGSEQHEGIPPER